MGMGKRLFVCCVLEVELIWQAMRRRRMFMLLISRASTVDSFTPITYGICFEPV